LLSFILTTVGVNQFNLEGKIGNIVARFGLFRKTGPLILMLVTNRFDILDMLIQHQGGSIYINILFSEIEIFRLFESLSLRFLHKRFSFGLTSNRLIFARVVDDVAGKTAPHIQIGDKSRLRLALISIIVDLEDICR
jgi:hypothetical protein